jgi:hypothetical protein
MAATNEVRRIRFGHRRCRPNLLAAPARSLSHTASSNMHVQRDPDIIWNPGLQSRTSRALVYTALVFTVSLYLGMSYLHTPSFVYTHRYNL